MDVMYVIAVHIVVCAVFIFACCVVAVYKFSVLFPRDVDQVHDMMDDIAEQQDVAKEISEAISNPVAFGHDVDEVSSEIFKKITLFQVNSII